MIEVLQNLNGKVDISVFIIVIPSLVVLLCALVNELAKPSQPVKKQVKFINHSNPKQFIVFDIN